MAGETPRERGPAPGPGGCVLSRSTEASDDDLVAEAAAALDIPEIAIFRRAWAHWYGADPEERRIERSFLVYMFGGPAPPWARDYARRVVAANRRELIDPRAWGVRSLHVRSPWRGFLSAVLAVTVLVVLVVLADAAAKRIAGVEACFTPPCYGDGESPGQR